MANVDKIQPHGNGRGLGSPYLVRAYDIHVVLEAMLLPIERSADV